MIQNIGERRFEADMSPFAKVESLGEPHVHVDHVRPLQDTDTTASKPSGIVWRQSKSTKVVKLLRSLVGVRVSDAIRTRNGPAGASHDHIGVRLIVGRRHGRRQPLAGL